MKDPHHLLQLTIYVCVFQGTQAMAVVMSRDRPHLSFALSLVSSEQTFDYPQQSWRFQSQYALRDYTGVYFIKLIPCTADEVSLKRSLTCLLFVFFFQSVHCQKANDNDEDKSLTSGCCLDVPRNSHY